MYYMSGHINYLLLNDPNESTIREREVIDVACDHPTIIWADRFTAITVYTQVSAKYTHDR